MNSIQFKLRSAVKTFKIENKQLFIFFATLILTAVFTGIGPSPLIAQTDWQKYPQNPVLKLGAPGSWEKFVVNPGVVFDGSTYHMWYTGVDQNMTFRIGYATSPDGVNWSKEESSNPVLDVVPGTWEQKRVEVPRVLFDGTTFHMWYTGFVDDVKCAIGYATSTNTETSGLTFTRIDTGAIVKELDNSQGSCWGDYDNDGFQDLYIINTSYFGQNKPDLLYHNEGDGTFTKTSGIIANEIIQVSGSAGWGDYDNDDDLDLMVSAMISRLYRNEGNGDFTKITSGIEDIAGDIGWVDYDNDGWLDLFGVWQTKEQNLLYHNNGDDTFARIDTGEIVNYHAYSLSANWADFDNDGDMDVFFSNLDFGAIVDPNAKKPRNCFYINEGGGFFTQMPSTAAVLSDEENTSGACWGDYDNDGYLDLFVENFRAANILYHNNGDGTFESFIIDPPEAIGANTIGCTWGDFDNDGDLDLFITSDRGFPRDPPPTFKENLLFRNDGDGNFTRITTGDVVKDGGHTCSVADYDNDGDLDILIVNGSLGPPKTNYLYSNDGNDNCWINITCVGTVSNRSAIGARVRAKATINGSPVWQLREIAQLTGEHSNNSMRVHFGLGDATVIDSLIIRWPSGIEDIYTGIDLNKFYCATEKKGFEEIYPETSIDENISNVALKIELNQNYPNPFNPSTTIEFDLPKTSDVTIKIFNILGEEVETLVSDRLNAGSYSYDWSRPAGIASGIYLYRLEAGDYVETRKMVLIR